MVMLMKKKISYLFMSLVFFNFLFLFYYYFKIVDFLYIELFNYNALINILIVNFIILIIDVFLILFYEFIYLSYFKMVLLGIVIGVIVCCFFSLTGEYNISDYLATISYFIINIIFICYSLLFDKEKKVVFG